MNTKSLPEPGLATRPEGSGDRLQEAGQPTVSLKYIIGVGEARAVSYRTSSMCPMSQALELIARDPVKVSALLEMVFRLMQAWRLDTRQQAILMGVRSPSTIYRWKNHGAKRLRLDTLERIHHLLGIHKRLRLLFYHNHDLAKAWVSTRNKAPCFGGERPIDIMLRGRITDLELVLGYLEQAAG